MSEKKIEKKNLKYKLKILVNGKDVGMKPFILNTLGKICEALLSDLKDAGEIGVEVPVSIKIDPQNKIEGQVKVAVKGKSLELNEYTEAMIWKTLAGYLITLTGMPDTFEKMLTVPISIDFHKLVPKSA